MKYLYFIALSLLTSWKVVAQEAPNMNNGGSRSASAIASGKQINIPVNYFTGIPNISIPIHSYTRSGISTGVSLDYFAGGIKVEEQASSVGLGWQLSAGGVITRNQRGLPDDFPGRGFLYTPVVDPGARTGRNPKRFTYGNYGTDSIDSEQDVFQYTIGGRSGSFLIGKNGKVVTIPKQNIQIRWKTGTQAGVATSNITEFTIIFEDGSSYLFSTPEITTRKLSGNYWDTWQGYVSAWHLSSITSTYAEDTIRFKYKSVLSAKYVKAVASRFERAGEPTINYNDSQYVRLNQKYLEQIIFPYNVTLNFLYDTAKRADAKQDYALKNIELRDSVLRMGYAFEYQYFSDNGTIYPYGSTAAAISKLKLNKLNIYTQFRTLKPYEFTYSPLKVPKVNSYSQDHWGYFNNAANTDLIPAVGTYTGANREPDSSYARSGVLTAVKYPSGAENIFLYESNDRKRYFYQENQTAIIGSSPQYTASKTFAITRYSSALAQLTIFVGRHNHCPVTITLKNAANQIIDQFDTDGTAVGTGETYNLPGGTYTLSMVPISSCGSTSIPECSMKWLNEVQDTSYHLMGGIRIKEIISKDGLNGAPPSIRRFRYVNPSGLSSGFAFFIPKYDYTFNVFQRNGNDKEYFVRVSAPMNNLDYVWGTSVGYSRVEEILPGNGKTVHEFTTYQDLNYFPSPPQYPFASELYPSWELGLPKKVSIVDQYNQVRNISENKYEFIVTTLSDTAFKSVKLVTNAHFYSTPGTFIGPGYETDTYYGLTGIALLDSTAEKTLAGTDTVIHTASFTYDTLHNLVSSKRWLSKDQQKYTQNNTYYPYNYTVTGALKTLRDSGIIVKVAEEQWMKTPTTENLIGASITGYEAITGNKIRPKYTYALQTDKPVPFSTIGAFSGSVLNRNATLIPLATTVERFDSKLVPLQIANNLTGQRQSLIWDDEHQIAISTIGDAAFTEIAYTSFEGTNHGNWTVPSGQYHFSDAVTGSRSYKLNGTISTTVTAGREYVVTYWTMGAGITINGTTPEKLATERVWNLYRNKLPSTTTSISITGSNLIIDELRAYPADAVMSSQTVNFFGNQTSTNSGNNKIAYTEYDDLARVRLLEDMEGNIMEMNCYGQSGEKVNCNTLYKNNAVSRRFVQTNCTGGKVPDTVLYTIAAGTYTSTISQYKADSLAMNAVIAGGPAYANANGGCSVIYAKLSYEDADLDLAPDLVVKFYADAACTEPKYVTNLEVVVGVTDDCEVSVPDVERTVSGTEATIIGGVIRNYEKTECDPPGFPCWTFQCHVTHVLKPGNYVIK